jgi:hypothetical protein
MVLTFQPSEIQSVKDVDPSETIAELNTRINDKLRRLGPDADAGALVDVAVFAFENGLKKRGHEVLEKAWAAASRISNARDGLLGLVAEHRAARLFGQADWYDSVGQEIFARNYCDKIIKDKDYCKTSYFAAAKKLLAMMDERKGIKHYEKTYSIEAPKATLKPPDPLKPIESSGSDSNSGSAAPKISVKSIASSGTDLTQANNNFQKGMDLYIQGMRTRGTPSSKKFLSKAGHFFGKAGEIYERAAQSDPGNSSLESRVLDCNRFRYACMKHSTL